jgi:hypothetical protein
MKLMERFEFGLELAYRHRRDLAGTQRRPQ